jgi:Telomere resolvase
MGVKYGYTVLSYKCGYQTWVKDMTTTIDELNQRRELIAKYDEQTLQMMTVPALKKLASGIVPGHSRMHKTDLIESLIKATKLDRVLAAIIPDTPLDVIEANQVSTHLIAENVHKDLAQWTTNLHKEFRKVVQSNWQNGQWDERIHADIAALGYRVVHFLNNREGYQDDGKLAFTTKLRYRTHICNLMTELVNSESETVYFKQLESCLEMLLKQIRFQISDITEQKKGLQERRLAERKQEKEIISFKPIYEFAVSVLNNLDKLKAPDWKKVSIALAIVTGRRMAEIHLSSTKFEYVDNQTCDFTGQLKVKGDAEEYFTKNPSYPIPVLVDARLVVAAHDWLKKNIKTVDDTRVAANRYTKDLSEAMKILKNRFTVEHDFFTYKGLRTIYAQVCSQVFNGNDADNTLYLAQVLGHGRGELLRSANLTDMLTPQSYNSDFRVVDTDCIKF